MHLLFVLGALATGQASSGVSPKHNTDLIESAAWLDFVCRSGLGTLEQEASNGTAISGLETLTDKDLIRLDRDVGLMLSGYARAHMTATFSAEEQAADFSQTNYFEGTLCNVFNAQVSARFLTDVCEANRVTAASYLRALREPDFSDVGDGSYRFLWLPKSSPAMSIRVFLSPVGPVLIGKLLAAATQSEPRRLCLRVEKDVSLAQFYDVAACFANADVWRPVPERSRAIPGGSHWVVEARHGGRRFYSNARIPDRGPLVDCALKLVELSGIPTGTID